MINRLIIIRVMGNLLILEAGLLLLSMGVDLAYGDHAWPSFILSVLISFAFGLTLRYMGRHAKNQMNRRDGYVIVSTTWIVFSAVGMLPSLFSGFIPNVADAFFEAMSGFSSTGATILDNIEEGTHGLLFWRSMTQWIGGLGIVFFTIAILPIFGLGDVKLFAAEATGPTHDKLHPRISTTAKRIWIVYSGLTLACTGFLMLGGLNFFDSICHSMTCTATGGFSNYQDSIAHFHSAYVEYILTFFMLISAMNFTLTYHSFVQGNVRRFFQDTELRWFLSLTIVATLICGICLFSQSNQEHLSAETSFRHALFQVVSTITTTGYASADYGLWPHVTWGVLGILMFTGSCAGSTTGGFKM
ncbi:MAG: TrkH family potassium uptake protein, partial [Bacteroidaceae bacterium]|nr:TrkH family potassium uptake protein [Bacteroidaceae bacterium]